MHGLTVAAVVLGNSSVRGFEATACLPLGALYAKDISGFAGAFPPSLENSEGVRIAGLVSHQFFRPYALTFDFERMRMILEKKEPAAPHV